MGGLDRADHATSDSAADHTFHRVVAEAVGDVLVPLGVEDQDVGLLPRLERADAVGAADGRRGVDRGRADRLGHREAARAARVLDHNLHAGRVTARADVGRERDAQAGVEQRAGVCRRGVLGGEIEQRHDHADHALGRERIELARRGVVEVVDGDRAELRRDRAAPVCE